VGEDVGLKVDALVYAFDSIPIGRVKEVNNSTSKVVLFSTSGEKTEVVIDGQPARNALSITPAGGDNFMELVGRGGGNFEMVIPRDFELASGTLVHLPGITPYVVAKVEDIISDPRDSLKKALLVSPVNIQNLKFVQVEK
jgi:cell shape-determining protein MreC